LFVLGLTNNLLSVSCMTYLHCIVAFEGQECIISNCSLASPRTLARGVRDGGLYILLDDPAHLYMPAGSWVSLLVLRSYM
jgi:hypothetical protein